MTSPVEREFDARWRGGLHTCKISVKILGETTVHNGSTSLQATPGRREQLCSSHKRWWHMQLASQTRGRARPREPPQRDLPSSVEVNAKYQEPHLPSHQHDLLPSSVVANTKYHDRWSLITLKKFLKATYLKFIELSLKQMLLNSSDTQHSRPSYGVSVVKSHVLTTLDFIPNFISIL